MNETKQYCTVCGKQMKEKIVGADNVIEWNPVSDVWHQKYDAYQRYTGKRNLIRMWFCPKKRFWNNHDEYYDDHLLK